MLEVYKHAIKESQSAATWDDFSFFFYMSLILFAIIIGFVIENTKKHAKTEGVRFLFVLLFLILAIPCCFRDTGDDTIVYRYVYLNAWNPYDPDVNMFEAGFLLLNRFLAFFVKDEIWGVAILTALIFFFITFHFYRYRNCTNVMFAIMGFVCVYYLQTYNIMRIYLASSIVLYNFKFFTDKKILKSLIVIAIATLFHYSAIVFLLPLFGYILYARSKKLFWFFYIALFVVLLGATAFLSDYIALINRYSMNLEDNETQKIGIAHLVYHLPLFAIIIISKKNKLWDNLTDWLLMFTLISLLMGFFSYKMPIAGRVVTHMMIIYTLLVPHQLYLFKVNKYKYTEPIALLYTFFLLFKLHMYLVTGFGPDAIMPFKFAF